MKIIPFRMYVIIFPYDAIVRILQLILTPLKISPSLEVEKKLSLKRTRDIFFLFLGKTAPCFFLLTRLLEYFIYVELSSMVYLIHVSSIVKIREEKDAQFGCLFF